MQASAPAVPEAWRRWLPRIYIGYAIAVGACLVGAFSESFANLITYFRHQGFALGLAIVAPSMVDVFTVGGEGLVLIATVNHWETRYKVAGWCATAAGLAVSVAGNVGKDGWHITASRAVAYAIAPLALAGLLALGLAIVKRALATPALVPADNATRAAIVPADTPNVPAAMSAPAVRAATVAAIPATATPATATPPRPPRVSAPTGKTDRDRVRALRDEGVAPKDIAEQLGISTRTVRRHAPVNGSTR